VAEAVVSSRVLGSLAAQIKVTPATGVEMAFFVVFPIARVS